MDLPDWNYFYELVNKFCVPARIVNHNLKVASVTEVISKHDGLALCLGLYHDVFKTASLSFSGFLNDPNQSGKMVIPYMSELISWYRLSSHFKGLHEIEVAARIIGDDYHDFADKLREVGSTNNAIYLGADLAVKIAHYADWRVQGTNIVPFKERLSYLERNYFKGDKDNWEKRKSSEVSLEASIFKTLDFSPSSLGEKVTHFLASNPQYNLRPNTNLII